MSIFLLFIRYRSRILKDNLKYINYVNSLNLTYELGITPFAHLTKDEFLNMNEIRGFRYAINNATSNKYVKHTNVDSVDWRRKGVVSPIQNQLSCGCCYAFAATELVYTAFQIHGKSVPVLSAQQIVDCSYEYGNNGCKGGSLGASLYYIKQQGLVPESAYPYSGKEDTCQIPSTESYTFEKWEQQSYIDEATLKDIVTERPVSVGIVSNWAPLQVLFS